MRGSAPGARHAVANAGLRALAFLVTLAALGLPAFFFWHRPSPSFPAVVEQFEPPRLRAADLANLPPIPPLHEGVPVLTYHGVAEAPPSERYTVTPYEFAVQMAALHRAGFHAISAAQFADYVNHRPVRLPARPVLITFDDGAKTVWSRADPVLHRYGFRATVFLITAMVGTHQPFYLTWEEITKMQRSGRWDFGSHTRDGHRKVQISPGGARGPFMTNLVWRADQGRMETLAEYRARVTRDLDGSIADMRARGLPPPLLFADPFSGTTGVANHPAILPVLVRIERARFEALVNNIEPAGFATPGPRERYVRRIEVFKGTSARGLLRTIVEAAARTRTGRDPRPGA